MNFNEVKSMCPRQTGYSAPILYKAFAVLEEVADNQSEFGVSDLSRRLSISKSTVYGITQALTDLGALRQDAESKKFRLGPTLIQLGNQTLADMDLRSIVRPLMDELSHEFKVTVFLGIFEEFRITIIEKVDSPHELRISAPVGTRIPIFAGATGKVFLAGLQEKALNKILTERSLPKYTENSITDPGKFREELKRVRQQLFATDYEEYIQGVNAVSAPVPESWGWPVAAIWMVGFSNSFNRENVEKACLAATAVSSKIRDMLKGYAAKSNLPKNPGQ
jgi:DNA-binding IclR family transcriptional regulator